MACPEARAVIAVKIFMKQDMIAKMRIGLKFFGRAKYRTVAIFVP